MSRTVGVAVFLLVALLALGCFPMDSSSHSAEPPKGGTDFASERAGGPAPFDPDRAMDYLTKLCDIGPRISGTDGMTKQQEFLTKHFTGLGAKVEFQKFTARQGRRPAIEMANLVVTWHPDSERRILLCSHYDTRPIADQEPNPRRWREPFVSANDGGSGVALLMELGHHVKDLKTKVGIDFVFFDGEEYIWEKGDEYFFGSKHFATTYRNDRPKHRYLAAVLLDMIGGKGARFPVEQNSGFLAGGVVQDVWATARELKVASFVEEEGPAVEDDHLALNRIGRIPAIDIIDFSYKHWHRLSDTPDNCSGESLEQAARVLSVWVQRVK